MKKTRKLGICLLVCGFALGLISCSQSAEASWQEQYDLGVRYLAEGNYEEAIIAFTAAIEIDPKRAEAYVGHGDAYIGSGETEDNLAAAQADYEKAIEIDASNAEAYLGLADVYIRKGEFDKAYEVLKASLEKCDGNQSIADKIAEIESGIYADSSNHIRRSNSYDLDGTLDRYTLYEYDFLGRQNYWENYGRSYNEESGEFGPMKLDDYCEVDFDEQNRPVQYRFYAADGTAAEHDTCVYDENGLKAGQYRYNSDDSLYCYFLFYYNDEGLEIKYEGYWADGTMFNYWIKEYDEFGNLTKEICYNPDGTTDGYTTYD